MMFLFYVQTYTYMYLKTFYVPGRDQGYTTKLYLGTHKYYKDTSNGINVTYISF
jgi:hypothetical protein